MKIRYCQKEDLEAIYKLICELEECNLNHEQFALVYENKLNDEKSHYLVAVSDDMIVGFVSVNIDYQLHHENKVATIEELVIDNSYRGNGIGRLLVDFSTKLALEHQCEVIELTSNFKRIEAVSYTHLDVYKRQTLYFVNINFISRNISINALQYYRKTSS